MISRLQLFLFAVLVAICPVQAADDIDPEKARAIRQLLEITGAGISREEWTRTFTQQLVSVLQANNARLPERAVGYIEEEVDAVVAEQLQQEILQRKMYRIYARYFTLEEIQGLIEFNQSAIGAKANRVMPVLMRESVSAAQDWSVEIGPLLSERVRNRLAREGIPIGQPGN